MKILLRQVILFGLAGTIGFCVDTGVLYLLKPSLGIYWARGVSFLFAVCATWVMNRNITFSARTSGKSMFIELMSYLGMMLAGGAANLLSYVFLVASCESVRRQPVLGVMAGSLVGMTINYIQLRLVMFRHPKP